jgi:hypothetical protein
MTWVASNLAARAICAASLRSRMVTSRSPVMTEISPRRGLLTYATMGSEVVAASASPATSAPMTVAPTAAPAERFTNARLV